MLLDKYFCEFFVDICSFVHNARQKMYITMYIMQDRKSGLFGKYVFKSLEFYKHKFTKGKTSAYNANR